MKNSFTKSALNQARHFATLTALPLVLTALLASTAAAKVKTNNNSNGTNANTNTSAKPEEAKTHERGWIGGEYQLARKGSASWLPFGPTESFIETLPPDLAKAKSKRIGLLIKALDSNTPAYQAGLRQGDLVLGVNRQPVTSLKAFWKCLDQCAPCTPLPIQAWRNNQTQDFDIVVGRETFKHYGNLCIGIYFPSLSRLGPLDVWPDPGFSLGVLGFQPTPTDRKELRSTENSYRRACNNGKYTFYDQDLRAWCGIIFVQKGKTILSQELASATSSPVSPESEPK